MSRFSPLYFLRNFEFLGWISKKKLNLKKIFVQIQAIYVDILGILPQKVRLKSRVLEIRAKISPIITISGKNMKLIYDFML